MKSLIFTAAIFLTIAQKKCGKNAAPPVPSCIQDKIEAIKSQPKWNPPARVEEYRYAGRRVFLFSSPCCDQYNEAFDDSCNYICAPTGGYTGKGDQKCPDFKDAATLVRVVWEDKR